MQKLKLVFSAFIVALATTLPAQTFTQRLNPSLTSDVNDVCPNDEVELTFSYEDPDNTSLLLNGLDEALNLGTSPNLNFGTGDFSVECFIKTSSLATQVLVSKIAPGIAGFSVGLFGGFVVGGISDGTGAPITVNGFTPIADGTWHHIVVVYERNDKMTIYTDGLFDNDANISGVGSVDNVDLMRIGAGNSGAGLTAHYNGYIDEVRVWNSALTVAEINARSTTHLNPVSYPDLVGYWDMNDVTAPTIIDCSVSGASGQMVGSASLSADAPVLTFPFLPQWSNGQTGLTQFVNPVDTIQYTVTVGYCKYASIDSITINVIECDDEDDSGLISSVWVPSAFTPNGDFKNDIFMVKGANITYYDIKIFNRFGNIMYHSRNILAGWDGTFEGEFVKDDVYTYIVTYRDRFNEEYTKHGTITVLK